MDESRVEAVAASLIREFLSRKGLKKTSVSLEEELPRTALSISNRNELRSALHLDTLYRENKLAEKPLKTLLEIITKFFLEGSEKNTTMKLRGEQNGDAPLLFTRGHPRKEAAAPSTLDLCDITDQEAGQSSAVSDLTRTLRSEDSAPSNRNTSFRESLTGKKITGSSVSSDQDVTDQKEVRWETRKSPDPPVDMKSALTETQRPRSGRIVRGMMSGVISSSQEDSQRKRSLRRSSGTFSAQIKEESLANGPTVSPADPALQLGRDFSAKLLISTRSQAPPTTAPIPAPTRQDRPPPAEGAADPYSNFKLKFSLGTEQEKQQKSSRKSASSSSKRAGSVIREEGTRLEDLKIDDVEEDLLGVEVAPVPQSLPVRNAPLDGRPLELQQAVELKKLLLGSALSSFPEEWRIQSLSFSSAAPVRFGLLQKKGGPCGVLAAVQACVLRHLLFGNDSDSSWALNPSDALRSSCLYRAIADMLWRAGDSKGATVTLMSGRPQFTPAGRYKADGILESLVLYTFNQYEELLAFLRQHVHQFEHGPHGCILLTVSAILSRSADLVQKDLDDPSSCLIGAHAYCTQELVNLLLGGRAVSNVFNDIMELDSGNGNITVLKGISSRSDIGLLSLFEHYGVCQVGSYLKTPKFPIWVVCSESHFSVLFCLKKDLLSDWRAERRFDLYYYDGLANQQEEIRLTIDTAGRYQEDAGDDLTPPLEHCIRTKWKGASVDWNGTEPIL